jgi:hypothetical protein
LTLFLAEAFWGFSCRKSAIGMGDEDYFFILGDEGSEAVPNGGDIAVEVWGGWDGADGGEVETDGGVAVGFEEGSDGRVD